VEATKYARRNLKGRASRKSGCVSGDNLGAKGWGIGLGLACGIVLAALALSDGPFFGHSRTELRPHRLPHPQSRNAEANIDPFAEVVDSNRPIAEPVPVVRSTRRPSAGDLQTIPTAQKMPHHFPPAPSLVSPLVPPPRDLDEDPQEQMKFARFLIKAQLAPIAADPLRKVVKEAPDTSIAREAQHTLDIISRN
jgi:hypothetical protein